MIATPKKAMISNHRMDAKLGAILAKLVSIRGLAEFERPTRAPLGDVLTEIRRLWVLSKDTGATANLERAITSVRRAISIHDAQVQGSLNIAICAIGRAREIFERPHINDGKA